ncbi:hypothetical protein HMPREF1054_0043 [Haemophilus paraphrohaemolyticus HK411]|uniref:Uncharacterized protein n=1 Tax=Haemophilus paraphrohaemolyticus HK411 TaxID=1095743 RepID=I2NJA3_9PAST|nr:hypothetical protein HMPREF1054_0043 [Haemophilus paraphrohaemolyticus HK411]
MTENIQDVISTKLAVAIANPIFQALIANCVQVVILVLICLMNTHF